MTHNKINKIQINIYDGLNKTSSPAKEAPIEVFKPSNKEPMANEIGYFKDINEKEIARQKYIQETVNSVHEVKDGENYSSIANQYNIGVNYLLSVNGLTGKETLSIGQELKIPNSRNAVNITQLSDVAKAMGVSEEFIQKLKLIEDGYKDDGTPYGDHEFHNTPYYDMGRKTIGIGHLMQDGDKKRMTNWEVLNTFGDDLLKMEENLWVVLGGKENYDKLPQGIKEALLDMTFNKGTAILENTEGLIWCLKNEKYEAAINKMTDIKSLDGKELTGLCKRRLFDISRACTIYGDGPIPETNLNTIRDVYAKGRKLLEELCKESKLKFENQIVGYDKDIRAYLGDEIYSKIINYNF